MLHTCFYLLFFTWQWFVRNHLPLTKNNKWLQGHHTGNNLLLSFLQICMVCQWVGNYTRLDMFNMFRIILIKIWHIWLITPVHWLLTLAVLLTNIFIRQHQVISLCTNAPKCCLTSRNIAKLSLNPSWTKLGWVSLKFVISSTLSGHPPIPNSSEIAGIEQNNTWMCSGSTGPI